MRNSLVSTVALLVAVTIAGPNFDEGLLRAGSAARSSGSAAAAQSKKRVTVPAGTRILVRTIDPLDTTKQKTGYRFAASLEANLQAEDVVVAPRGTKVYGRLAEASSAGRMSGSSELSLELTDIMINDTAYPVVTSEYEIKGKGEGKKTAGKILGGTGLGALIGGIAGGGAGAAIGALAGAAGGTAVAASKKGEQLQIPSESLIEFRLEQPASLPLAR
jgi:hypothetical protein